MRKIAPVVLATCLLGLPDLARAQTDEEQVQQALSEFLRAFGDLNWERFQASFTDDATVFMFDWRSKGRRRLEDSAFAVMERRRAAASQKGAPPYLKLEPRDLVIDVLGDAALVTFHLGDVESDRPLNQRTLVLVREADAWKIHHLHASSLNPPADASP